MSELMLAVGDQNVITVRLEPNSVQGRDMGGQPGLYLPLRIQLLPGGQKQEVEYTLLRLAGKISHQPLGEFATFDAGPLALVAHPNLYFRHQEVLVGLDRQRVKRFEEARAANDANLDIMVSALLWHPTEQEFEAVRGGPLQVQVPKSHWVESVLSA